MTPTLIHGPLREHLATVADHTFDSIVTDPPYALTAVSRGGSPRQASDSPAGRHRVGTDHGRGLPGRTGDAPRAGFMGKTWDGALLTLDDWRELLRVAKPGAYLVAFGGTRTWHRQAVMIEDAGWEMRDSIFWLHGQGFPKSLNVSKAIDARRDWSALKALQAKVRDARKAKGWTQTEAARRMGLIGPQEKLGGGGYMWYETGMRVPTADEYPRLKAALELDDSSDAAFQAAEREVIGQHTSALPGLPGKRFVANTRDVTVAGSDLAKQWEGWGTALKPACEPIVVARKPPIGTIAENIAAYGVGALHVDAGRLDVEREPRALRRGATTGAGMGYHGAGPQDVMDGGLGRWPANVVVDEAVAAMIDQQSGDRPAGHAGIRRGVAHITLKGLDAQDHPWGTYGDSGGASRFFYCAKASRAERDEGLEDLPPMPATLNPFRTAQCRICGTKTKAEGQGEPGPSCGHDDWDWVEQDGEGARNTHPTVKPVALMRWLVNLITPAGGLVLDPCMGSGTTGVACELDGFTFYGIDREAEYLPIATRRINHARRQPSLWEPDPVAAQPRPAAAPAPIAVQEALL